MCLSGKSTYQTCARPWVQSPAQREKKQVRTGISSRDRREAKKDREQTLSGDSRRARLEDRVRILGEGPASRAAGRWRGMPTQIEHEGHRLPGPLWSLDLSIQEDIKRGL